MCGGGYGQRRASGRQNRLNYRSTNYILNSVLIIDPLVAIYDNGRFWCMTGQMLPGTPTCCEPRQKQLDALLEKLFPPRASSNGRAHSNGKAAGNWFNKLLAYCAVAAEGQRSERDFALCAAAVRHGFTADEIWSRVANVGKFAEGGREYFDRTW
jgi:hypothetical protein